MSMSGYHPGHSSLSITPPDPGNFREPVAFRKAWCDFLLRFEWSAFGVVTPGSVRTSGDRIVSSLREAMQWIREATRTPVMWFCAVERQSIRGAAHAHALLGGIDPLHFDAVVDALNEHLPHPRQKRTRAFMPFDEMRRREGVSYVTKDLVLGGLAVFEGAKYLVPPLCEDFSDDVGALVDGRGPLMGLGRPRAGRVRGSFGATSPLVRAGSPSGRAGNTSKALLLGGRG